MPKLSGTEPKVITIEEIAKLGNTARNETFCPIAYNISDCNNFFSH
jgi:hypothetical protein